MASSSSKALYVVRATPRNISGANVVFDVADGIDPAGRPTFSGRTTRQVPPGRTVLGIPVGRADLKIGLYRVAAGHQMQARETALVAGETVAITCPPDGPEGVPQLSGSIWTVIDDQTVVNAATGPVGLLLRQIADLASRIPLKPEPPLEAEVSTPAPVDPSLHPER